jgi:hypothetical protein
MVTIYPFWYIITKKCDIVHSLTMYYYRDIEIVIMYDSHRRKK